MFSVIYLFHVIPGKEDLFANAWHDLTVLIYQHEGSFGSRLHKNSEHYYLAYAQWPDKLTWQNAGANLPQSADAVRTQMREACLGIKTLYELEIIDDLLVGNQFEQSTKNK